MATVVIVSNISLTLKLEATLWLWMFLIFCCWHYYLFCTFWLLLVSSVMTFSVCLCFRYLFCIFDCCRFVWWWHSRYFFWIFWLLKASLVMTFSRIVLYFLTVEVFFRDDILAISFGFFDYWSHLWRRHSCCFFWIFWLLKPSLEKTFSLFPFWFFDYWRFLRWIHYHCFFRILWLQKVSLGMTFSFCLYIQGSLYKLSDQELSLFTFPTFVKFFLFFLNLPFFQLPL